MIKTKNLLKIAWLCLLLCFSAACVMLFIEYERMGINPYYLWFAFVLGVLAWLYITVRFLFFRMKIIKYIKRILDNDYESGIKIKDSFSDEITGLERLVNKMADQLRIYSRLQSDKISFLGRSFDFLCDNVKEGIIIADIKEKNFQLNREVRLMFKVEQEFISFDSIEKQKENADFVKFFTDCVQNEKTVKEAKMVLRLPIRESEREVFMRMVPFKNRDENVETVIIFVGNP